MDSTMLHSAHPLFRELRNGLLWHCTSRENFTQILTDGFIKFNQGRAKFGPYACQELGGVSLFDFTAESEERVIESLHKWQQFLRCGKTVTIVMGLERKRLPGGLTPYPENGKNTTGNVIPWVEVCHQGNVPVSAITTYLLVCPADYSFHKHKTLNAEILDKVQMEFADVARKDGESMAKICAVQESPEFKKLLNQAKLAAANICKKVNPKH